MSAQKIWCQGEGHAIPVSELLHNPDGTLFKPETHTVPHLHYCSTGLPPLLPAIPGALLYLSAVAHQLSQAEIDESVKLATSLTDLVDIVKSKLAQR